MRLSERLARKPVFWSAVAGLFLVSFANVYRFRSEFSVLAGQLVRRQDAEVARWQAWGLHYRRLFAMLKRGERVGIMREAVASTGIILERTAEGVTARRSLFVSREKPGVVLTFQEKTAEEFLWSVPHTDPEAIWQTMKDHLNSRQITVWCDADLDRLYRGGYLHLMRAIDTRPPNVEWPVVKEKIGEK